tara:strand:- start:667 stop:1107 length:441 start_codon:yes stop_codon:yes gene_type:complete
MNEEEIGAIAKASFKPGIYSSKGRFYNGAAKELVQYESAEEAALALAVQNIASCQARYPNHGEIAGGFLKSAEEEKAYLAGCAFAASKAKNAYMKPMELYGLVKTYEYQACETNDWYEANAFWFCNAVAHQAASAEQRAQEEKEVV